MTCPQNLVHVSRSLSLAAEERDAVVATRLSFGGSGRGDFPREVALNVFLFPRLGGFSDGLCLKQTILFPSRS
jgi:hypothetical protein